MVMFNPPHPGETLLEDVLPELGISIAELARRLGFARESLSRVLHGHAPISPDLVVRLELAGIGKACTLNRPGFLRHFPGSVNVASQTLPVTAGC